MKHLTIAILLLTFWAPNLVSQEYQSHFPKEEYQSRWGKIFDHIGDEAIAVIQGAEDPGGFVYPRQTNTFYYLCGVENSYAYLVLDGKNREVTLYLAPNNSRGWERVLTTAINWGQQSKASNRTKSIKRENHLHTLQSG